MKLEEMKQKLSDGAYDESLTYIYCCNEEKLKGYKQRIEKLCESFEAYFGNGSELSVVSAAGRTEIGGNHTDHQRGKVLTGSVDLDALACIAFNGSDTIRIYSEKYGETAVNVHELTPVKEEENTTKALVRGVAAGITEKGHKIGGFNAYVISDVPGGSGLSSSACFEVLMGVAMNHLFAEDKLSMVDLAKIGQYAENVFFGKPSGLMDQMGCAVGGLVSIDFKDKENPVYHHVDSDFSKAGYALCIIDSGADHADLTGDYSAIPMEMRAAAAVCGKEVLSEVPEEEFMQKIKEVREKAGDRAVLRAVHYYADCARVEKQVAALEEGDFAGFLNLITESGHSSFEFLQNVSTYHKFDDQPVAYALAAAQHALKGKGAVRVHGGGFAGTIQAFVPVSEVEEFRREVDRALFEGSCRVTGIRPLGGAVLI